MDDNDPDEFVESTCQPLAAVRQVAIECQALEAAASASTTTTTTTTTSTSTYVPHDNPE